MAEAAALPIKSTADMPTQLRHRNVWPRFSIRHSRNSKRRAHRRTRRPRRGHSRKFAKYTNRLPELPVLPHGLSRSSPEKTVTAADGIMQGGWKFGKREPYPVETPIDWAADPYQDRGWRMWLNAWRILEPVLAAYDETKDKCYLEFANGIALDWIDQHIFAAQQQSVRLVRHGHRPPCAPVWENSSTQISVPTYWEMTASWICCWPPAGMPWNCTTPTKSSGTPTTGSINSSACCRWPCRPRN